MVKRKEEKIRDQGWGKVRKKWFINLFLVLLIPSLILDAFPAVGPYKNLILRYQWKLRPVLFTLGIWQQNWELFAPDPIDERIRLTAILDYPDGSVALWHSPKWHNMGLLKKKRLFRIQEYIDAIRDEQAMWPHLCKYLARAYSLDDDDDGRTETLLPSRVLLRSHRIEIFGPQPELDSSASTDNNRQHHWLLGYPVVSTLGGERTNYIYEWLPPANNNFENDRVEPLWWASSEIKFRPQSNDEKSGQS